MRLGISHLSGAKRGQVETLSGTLLRVGSGDDCELNVKGSRVRRHHATIHIKGIDAHLEPHGEIRVNGQPAGEVILHNYDLLEVGRGAKLRVRLLPDDTELPARPPLRRRGFSGITLVALLLLALGVGAYLWRRSDDLRTRLDNEAHWSAARQRAAERRWRGMRSELNRLQAMVDDRSSNFDERVGAVQRAVAEVESNVLDRVTTEIERSLDRNPDLKAARDAVHAGERIIARHAGAVCLVQGGYGFGRMKNGTWRFLREADPELFENLDTDGRKVPLMLEGKGPVFKVEFTGTGFLADPSGIIVTNRHIAQPWWQNEAAKPLLTDGFEPRFIYLRIYFPGRKKPLSLDARRAVVSDEGDIAALHIESPVDLPEALPIAPKEAVVIGRRVLMLGYPSGLNALLARSDEKLIEGDDIDPLDLLEKLSARGLIRPLPTRGHISDLVGPKLLFDAPTAVGASGAPILDMKGQVVGVNYGILKSFSGANFGVPAGPVRRLLEKVRSGTPAAARQR